MQMNNTPVAKYTTIKIESKIVIRQLQNNFMSILKIKEQLNIIQCGNSKMFQQIKEQIKVILLFEQLYNVKPEPGLFE